MTTTHMRRGAAVLGAAGLSVFLAAGPASADSTKQEAAQAAVNQYGGCVINVESDDYDGEPAWEVEMRKTNTNDAANGRIEVKVNKASGEVVAKEDADSDDGQCDDSYPSAIDGNGDGGDGGSNGDGDSDSDSDGNDGSDAEGNGDSAANGGSDTDGNDSDGDTNGTAGDSDNDAAGGGGNDSQVSPQPNGGADTGGGSTADADNTTLIAAGAGIATLGAAGLLVARRRTSNNS